LERDGLVTRLVDPKDARATLIDITDAGRAWREQQRRHPHERVAEVVDTLRAEEELELSLAMCAALPVLEQLSRNAALQWREWHVATVLSG
jgi:DNA-binding MarR family transcriptional regulator